MTDSPIFDKLARGYVRREVKVTMKSTPSFLPGAPLWFLVIEFPRADYHYDTGVFESIGGAYREALRLATDAWRVCHDRR